MENNFTRDNVVILKKDRHISKAEIMMQKQGKFFIRKAIKNFLIYRSYLSQFSLKMS